LRQKGEQFQEKCAAVFRPELRQRRVSNSRKVRSGFPSGIAAMKG
jgi:hypothetical protein